MQFRYIDKNYRKKKDTKSFSPSGLCMECPLGYFFSATIPKEVSAELQKIFDVGNDQHDREVIFNTGSRGVILAEEKMKIIHIELGYIISAKPDHIKFDFDGRYIEDYKTCEHKSLKKFISEKGMSMIYVWQLSIYAYVYYINTGVIITRGVITKIDKKHPRNRVSKEFPLMSIEETEKYITTHPAVLYMTGQEDIKYLLEKTQEILTTIDCQYCDYRAEHEAIYMEVV